MEMKPFYKGGNRNPHDSASDAPAVDNQLPQALETSSNCCCRCCCKWCCRADCEQPAALACQLWPVACQLCELQCLILAQATEQAAKDWCIQLRQGVHDTG